MVLSIDELAGIAHIPNREIEVPNIPWKTSKTGSDISAGADKDQSNTASGQAWATDDAQQATDDESLESVPDDKFPH